jgi:hypothetical protein
VSIRAYRECVIRNDALYRVGLVPEPPFTTADCRDVLLPSRRNFVSRPTTTARTRGDSSSTRARSNTPSRHPRNDGAAPVRRSGGGPRQYTSSSGQYGGSGGSGNSSTFAPHARRSAPTQSRAKAHSVWDDLPMQVVPDTDPRSS